MPALMFSTRQGIRDFEREILCSDFSASQVRARVKMVYFKLEIQAQPDERKNLKCSSGSFNLHFFRNLARNVREKMAYGFQPGLSMPESDFPLEERIPGYYGYCQPENGYWVGYGLPSVATCPVSNHIGTEAENTCMNNAIPSPCPYGFLSANWLEEQQSWYPQPAPFLFDDGQSSYPEPAKCFPNDGQSWSPESLPFSSDGSQSWCPEPPTYPVDGRQPWFPEPPPYPVDGRQPWFPEHSSYSPYGWSSGQQATGNSVIGFENFGISGVSDFSVPRHGMDLALQHSVNRDSPLSNVKRRNSCHIGSWDRNIEHDVTANRKARRQSMYNPSTVNDNKPFFTSAINVDRNLESTEFQIHLVDFPSNSNKHLASFVDSVKQIRNKYPASDSASNPGRIWSVTMMFPSDPAVGSQVTVTVIGDIIPQPVTCIQKGKFHDITHRDLYPCYYENPLYNTQKFYPMCQSHDIYVYCPLVDVPRQESH
ncbi:uncharacterized protein LOC128664934 [Bombina bombina]|uniref:uncharacterized protein LOC128664934 n=1 Tax=Bombina bombina TaxID=8345 RepID=UPI00235A8AD4|nr:uncharacterized protein LOC128664934 [Bombina bombina]